MSNERLSEYKERISRGDLSNSIGLLLDIKETVMVILKSPAIVLNQYEPTKDRQIYVFGITNCETEARELKSAIDGLEWEIDYWWSKEDMNFRLIVDFISFYLRKKFYDKKSEKPMSLEFFVVCFGKTKYVAAAIDLKGGVRYIASDQNVMMIGCPNHKKSAKVVEFIGELDSKTAQEVYEQVPNLLADFEGKLYMFPDISELEGDEPSNEPVLDLLEQDTPNQEMDILPSSDEPQTS